MSFFTEWRYRRIEETEDAAERIRVWLLQAHQMKSLDELQL